MSKTTFKKKLKMLRQHQEKLIRRSNKAEKDSYNGIYTRYRYPVVTNDHIPLHWRFDLNPATNPLLLERIGVNATFNSGAIEHNGKICLIVRVEGFDRKSYFAVAESKNGVDSFRFWDYPVVMPPADEAETNIYDMRLTRHEDGWIYGLFCAERKDPEAAESDTSSAIACCGIARTHDLITWERLSDLKTKSLQQRNVVLHPEYVNGKYALYTRPQDSFIEAGGGIGWALTDSMENAIITNEEIIDGRVYHTIKETKNGQGPPPLKTTKGWLHLAHGVRNCAAGLRYVLYMFMTDLYDPSNVIYRPGGYFMASQGDERVGDVSNVLFSNGWVAKKDGSVFIYYGSSDTRMHVATTTIDRLLDYVSNTPEDRYSSYKSVETLFKVIEGNKIFL